MPECLALWKASEGVGLRPEEDLTFFLKCNTEMNCPGAEHRSSKSNGIKTVAGHAKS